MNKLTNVNFAIGYEVSCCHLALFSMFHYYFSNSSDLTLDFVSLFESGAFSSL